MARDKRSAEEINVNKKPLFLYAKEGLVEMKFPIDEGKFFILHVEHDNCNANRLVLKTYKNGGAEDGMVSIDINENHETPYQIAGFLHHNLDEYLKIQGKKYRLMEIEKYPLVTKGKTNKILPESDLNNLCSKIDQIKSHKDREQVINFFKKSDWVIETLELQRRKKCHEEFESLNGKSETKEQAWQDFCVEYSYILGFGYEPLQHFDLLLSQPIVRPTSIDGKGELKADMVVYNQCNSLSIVEIKRHNTPLFKIRGIIPLCLKKTKQADHFFQKIYILL